MAVKDFDVRPLDAKWLHLAVCGSNVTSQAGEDGVIRAVFDCIGVTNKCCFEVGAADGKFLSNTFQFRNDGWGAVLIESNFALYGKLRAYESDTVTCYPIEVGDTTLDAILAHAGMPKDMDLGVIDIDNQDYYAWMDMVLYRPRVMMVEVSNTTPPQPAMYIPARGEEGSPGVKQATEDAIIALGDDKGYQAVARVGVNVVFVARESL